MLIELDLNIREIHDLINFYEDEINRIYSYEMDRVCSPYEVSSFEEERMRYQEFIENLKGYLEKL